MIAPEQKVLEFAGKTWTLIVDVCGSIFADDRKFSAVLVALTTAIVLPLVSMNKKEGNQETIMAARIATANTEDKTPIRPPHQKPCNLRPNDALPNEKFGFGDNNLVWRIKKKNDLPQPRLKARMNV